MSYRDGEGISDACPASDDCNGDGVVDSCEPDCDGNGVPDACDLCAGADDSGDADGDGTPDNCDLCEGFDDGADNDGDGGPDGCDTCAAGSYDIALLLDTSASMLQEFDAVLEALDLYVNEYTEDLGDDGVAAIETLFREGATRGVLPEYHGNFVVGR